MAYIGKSPTGSGVRQRYVYTATGGETSLSGADDNTKTLQFTDGEYVDVHLNGVLLVQGTDYGVGTANTISSLEALSANDVVEITVYDVYNVAKINSEAMRNRWYFTATGGETSIGTSQISNLVFPANAEIDVKLNGVTLQAGTDYNTTSANTVGGLSALTAGQVIEIVYYEKFVLADTVSKASGGNFAGGINVDGRVGIGTTDPSSNTSTYYDDLVIKNDTSGSGAGITLQSNTTNGFSAVDFRKADGTEVGKVYASSAGGQLGFETGGTERMRINADGTWGKAPAGTVLQVKQAVETSAFTTTAQSYTTIGDLSVSITPTSTSSKILVMANVHYNANTRYFGLRFYRGTTAIAYGDTVGNREEVTMKSSADNGVANNIHLNHPTSMTWLDSPSTTSATTYSVKGRVHYSAGTGYINRTPNDANYSYSTRAVSTITVMEIAG